MLPEYNPFKYQSFPMHAAGETARLRAEWRIAWPTPAPGSRRSSRFNPPRIPPSASAVVELSSPRCRTRATRALRRFTARRLRPFFASYPDAVSLKAARRARRRYRLTSSAPRPGERRGRRAYLGFPATPSRLSSRSGFMAPAGLFAVARCVAVPARRPALRLGARRRARRRCPPRSHGAGGAK